MKSAPFVTVVVLRNLIEQAWGKVLDCLFYP